ncbi:hypothetical protein ACH4LT_27680 [Streptomyces clavifer]|uniref:hypothetical protein n=1 Tax=Streptomyces clavifer TaxID=68188 RepID=UPI0037A35BA2
MVENGVSGVAVVQRLSDLAGPAGGGGAGRAELKHSDGPWLRAARGAEALCAHLGPVPSELAAAHEGLVAGAGALSALAELGAVRTSWERRIAAARDECAGLGGALRAVARAQGETNETVRASFTPVADKAGAR